MNNKLSPTLAADLGRDYGHLTADASDLFNRANAVVVETDEDAARAADLVRVISSRYTSVEEERAAVKKPFLEGGRTVDAFFGAITKTMSAAKLHVTELLAQYAKKKKAESWEPEPEKFSVKTDYGTTAFSREVWTYEVTDLSQVPREYLMINDAAVKAAIKAKRRDIPGLRIFQQEKVVVR